MLYKFVNPRGCNMQKASITVVQQGLSLCLIVVAEQNSQPSVGHYSRLDSDISGLRVYTQHRHQIALKR